MKRGEIYFVNLDPVVGREQSGHRPVLVVSIDAINSAPLVVTVVPGTAGANIRKDYPHSVRIPASATGLPAETVFLCFQIRALDESRFPYHPVGTLPDDWMATIEDALRYCQARMPSTALKRHESPGSPPRLRDTPARWEQQATVVRCSPTRAPAQPLTRSPTAATGVSAYRMPAGGYRPAHLLR
jgi:mRNA interferase MazF